MVKQKYQTKNQYYTENQFDNKNQFNNIKKVNNFKFDIWSLYDLQNSFIKELQYHQLNSKLEKEIIEWQRQKIKILRYNLDSFYTYKIISYQNFIFIHHLWHSELFDIDQYDINIDHIKNKNTIEYTLGNIFDMLMNKIINQQYDLNNSLILSIIINIYPFARFNYKYFKYIHNNCQHISFKNKVSSRILLYELINNRKD